MRLGADADLKIILRTFQSVCGTVDPLKGFLLLYGAKRAENEDFSSWGCRIEDHLIKA